MSEVIRDLFTPEEWELLVDNSDSPLSKIAALPLTPKKEADEDA